jgi:acyl-CoA thioesterase I
MTLERRTIKNLHFKGAAHDFGGERADGNWQTTHTARPANRTKANLDSGKSQVIVTYGTSLTACGAWVRPVTEMLQRHYGDLVTVINSGGGAKWSGWGLEHLDTRVIDKGPDTVFIEFAINDAYLPYKTSVEQARDNLESMIERILEANEDCEIILMVMNPPVGAALEHRPKVADYYQMYREVAGERKLKLIDHYVQWEKILNEDPELFKMYVPDGLHPSDAGCQAVIAPAIVTALGLAP